MITNMLHQEKRKKLMHCLDSVITIHPNWKVKKVSFWIKEFAVIGECGKAKKVRE